MKMQSFPKFQTCNTPACILDCEWKLRAHHKEDACCYYLLESQKNGAETNFMGASIDKLYQIACAVCEEVSSRQAPIKRCITRAKTTASRMLRFSKKDKND